MKKYILLIPLICVFSYKATGQTKWSMGLENNFDVYKPYTFEAQNTDKKIRSYTCGAFVTRNIMSGKRWDWSSGLAIKTILHQIEKFDYIEDEHFLVDVKSLSVSIGLRNEYNWTLVNNTNQIGLFGLQSTIYFFECYASRLYDQNGYHHSAHYLPAVKGLLVRNFPLSSANLVLFYRRHVGLQNKHPIGFTASLGTNLYSDWDQFSRYAWVGFGVDMGFGKKVATKEPKQP